VIAVGDLVTVWPQPKGVDWSGFKKRAGESGIVVQLGTDTFVDEEMEHHTHDWAEVLLNGERLRVDVNALRRA
jgi:hypothetical protein